MAQDTRGAPKPENGSEDEEIVRRAQEEPEAYGNLYKKYFQRIYLYIFKRSGRNRETAEDMAQDTFVRAFRSLGRFRILGYSYLSYLIRIAHNLLVNRYRKGAKQDILLSALQREIAQEARSPGEEYDLELERRRLREAIGQLPSKDQKLLSFYYERELSHREIGIILGKSPNAVKLQLARIRMRLLRILKRRQTPREGSGVSTDTSREADAKKGREKA